MRNVWPSLFLLAACGGGSGTRAPDGPPIIPPFMAPAPAGNGGIPKLEPPPEPFLMAGDLLSVSVFRQPDLALEVRIPNDGSITYPLIGAVQASGKSVGALEREIRQRLEKDFLNEPSVTVTVKDYAKRKVFILGAVIKPGGYEITPTERMTLLQLVAAAEGYTDRAYKEYAQLVRRNGSGERKVIRLSLTEVEKAVARGQGDADPELWPGDLVVIPAAARVVYVFGAVNHPGHFEIPTDTRMTVLMAVSRAGSYTRFAATGRVQVYRTTPAGEAQQVLVDLDAILGGKRESDIDLQPGDVVWVPERGIF